MDYIYLDHAATTRPSEAVRAAMHRALSEAWGNPSSPHTMGVEAERLVTAARRQLATTIGAAAEDVVFTSGGTEANALAILGAARARARRKRHIITTNVEHSSVANACAELEREGFTVTRLSADAEGLVHPEQVVEALTPETALVTIMWVNNEVGAIQPVLEVAAQVKALDPDVLMHADGVQALGNVPLRVAGSALDLVSFSAHKIQGPKGVGALWIRAGTLLHSPWGGGSQERGLRPGTENVPGIAGMGVAAEAAQYDATRAKHMGMLRERLWERIEKDVRGMVPLRRNGPRNDASVAPHILNVSFVGLKGEVLVHGLAEQGVYASTGAACSSRRQAGSTTLRALGRSESEVEGALRFSLSPQTTTEEIDSAAERIVAVVAQLHPFAR